MEQKGRRRRRCRMAPIHGERRETGMGSFGLSSYFMEIGIPSLHSESDSSLGHLFRCCLGRVAFPVVYFVHNNNPNVLCTQFQAQRDPEQIWLVQSFPTERIQIKALLPSRSRLPALPIPSLLSHNPRTSPLHSVSAIPRSSVPKTSSGFT